MQKQILQQQAFSLRVAHQYSAHLFILAAVLLGSGLVTFIAANWSHVSLLNRFLLVQGLFVISAITTWQLNRIRIKAYRLEQSLSDPQQQYRSYIKRVRFKWASFATCLLTLISLGGFFALIGQTYQTGADAWQLFALWSALALPWVLYQRQSLIWLFWLLLVNLTLMLFVEQMNFDNEHIFLVLGLANLIFWRVTVKAKSLYWVSILMLLLAQVSFHILNDEIDGWDNLLWLSIWSIGILLVCFDIYLRREPISFALMIFYLLVEVNSVIFYHLADYIKDSFLFLLISISFLLTSGLFFAYLRFIYLRWRQEGEVFSASTQLYLRRTLTVLKSSFAWLITVTIFVFILIILHENNLITAVVPFLLISLLVLSRKILSDGLINQSITVFLFSLLSPAWTIFMVSDIYSDSFNTSLKSTLLISGLLIILLQWLAFILMKSRMARTVSTVLLALYKVFFCIVLLTPTDSFETLTFEQILFSRTNLVLLITLYTSLLFLIFSQQIPKMRLSRIFPLSAIPNAAWWGILWVIGGVFSVFDFSRMFYVYDDIFYAYQFGFLPLVALSLLFLLQLRQARKHKTTQQAEAVEHVQESEKGSSTKEASIKRSLIKQSLIKQALFTERTILLFLPLIAVMFLVPNLAAVSFAITLILLALVFRSTFNLVAAWLYLLLMLCFNYYNLQIPLISKASELLLSGGVLFVIMIVISYLLAKPQANSTTLAENELDEQAQQHRYAKYNPILVIVGLSVPLLLGNFNIWNFERLLQNGQIIRFEIAPVDPRSLIQGDYMALRYTIEDEVLDQFEAQNDQTHPAEPTSIVTREGEINQYRFLSYHLDKNNVAQLDRLYEEVDSDKLAENEYVIPFVPHDKYWYPNTLKLSHSYFFPEGYAHQFDRAKYAEFRGNKNGKLVLSQLLDAEFQPILVEATAND